MFAVLAAITSALSAINSTIATFKEGKANAQDAAALLGKFGSTAQRLDDWERKKKLKRPLTPKEAMDLSIKRREIKNIDEEDKKIIIEALWDIIYSDEDADMYETNLMRRLSGLLYLDPKIVGDIKEKIRQKKT